MQNTFGKNMLVLTSLSCCFLMAQKPKSEKENFQAAQLAHTERYFRLNDDSTLFLLYRLSKNQKYQTVIDVCKDLLERSPTKREYYAFLASSFYNTSQKDSATFYTLKYLNKRAEGDISLTDIQMFEKYPTFFSIYKDTVFQNKMLAIYLNDYRKKTYPRSDLGLDLIRLAYTDQRIRILHLFEKAWSSNQTEVDKAREKFIKADEINNAQFRHLYKSHPEYISKAEVGREASNHQLILITHVSDSATRYGIILPILKKAMDRKEVSPDTYVDQYTHALLNDGKVEEAKRITDSLCKLYKCINKIKWE